MFNRESICPNGAPQRLRTVKRRCAPEVSREGLFLLEKSAADAENERTFMSKKSLAFVDPIDGTCGLCTRGEEPGC
jgi:hypothetical protein